MIKKVLFTALFSFPLMANAIVFDSWVTNEGDSGNYILTITEQSTDGIFDFNLTVNPWNAEALGLFIDLGDYTVPSLSLSSIIPSGEVSLYAADTSSNDCGAGCNLNGLNPTLFSPDGEWEMVYRLGSQGFNNIQTFSWVTSGLTGINENDFGLIGIRAQQLCDPGNLLPNGSCGGSDKSYNDGGGGEPPAVIPEPGTTALFSIGLLGMGLSLRRRKRKIS